MCQIESTKEYSLVKWHADLKEILIACSTHSTPTVLILSEAQIVNEMFLEDITDLLMTGEVPSLYQPEDHERIVGESWNYA